ncbi:MAG: methyl-accepting chemotaxis protein [Treponema sp.]|nr:methyl-accepting chemotaxis protein [Treponema sp.]
MADTIIKPFSKKVAFFYANIFVAPVVSCMVWLSYINVVPGEAFLKAIKTPFFLACVALIIAALAYCYISVTKRIRTYDGSEEKLHRMNKAAKRYESFTLIMGAVGGFIYSFIFSISFKTAGVEFRFLPVFLGCVGCNYLFALFFYILFMQNFENNLQTLPFRSEYKSLPLTVRAVFVTFFGIAGLCSLVMSPLTVPAFREIPVVTLYTHYVVPALIGGALFIVLCTYLLNRAVAKRLSEIAYFTNFIADKNYTSDKLVVHSRDDYGVLINDLNDFHDTTRTLLKGIENSIAISIGSAEDLSDNMQETSASMEQIMANINSVKERVVNQSAGVEESQSTVASMNNHIDRLHENIEAQNSSVATSSSAVEEMVANIRSVTDILAHNSQNVENLSQESESGRDKIHHSVELADTIIESSAGLLDASRIIQNIASQTNLLAMNAAIEAAHAGESGKGFAVVADEIRKLAEQSNKQGKAITTQLKGLQEAINNVVDNTKVVQKQFDVIFELTSTVARQEEVIKNAMDEQSAGSAQVLQSLSEIKSASETVRASADELKEGGKQISDEMGILANVTLEINQAMLEMSQGAEKIVGAVENVNVSSNRNTQALKELEVDVKSFKV